MEEKIIAMACPLIGLEIGIVSPSSRELEGIKGKVIDETKNMLIIEIEDGKIKKIPKKGNSFEVLFRGKKIRIEGRKIMFRPEEKAKNIKVNM